MRAVRFLLLAALMAPVLEAQEERPAGWMVRFDRAGVTEADVEKLVVMEPGWHITTGRGAGIYYDPSWQASGEYTVTAKIFLFDPGQRHREAYGIFFGGSDLQGDNQAYSYFLLRDTGEYIIKKRMGTDAPTVVGWTASDAIEKWPGEGTAENVLSVTVGASNVDFYVNGTKVRSLPRAELATDGGLGLRLNHALDVHVSEINVEQM